MSFLAHLKQIRAGALLVASVAALVSKIVIRSQMVPNQLDWLADAGVLAAMAALTFTPLTHPKKKLQITKLLVTIVVIALFALRNL
jgi:hypothetical protein